MLYALWNAMQLPLNMVYFEKESMGLTYKFLLPLSVVGVWSILCAGHHNNRVRSCDAHGCGAFNSRR